MRLTKTVLSRMQALGAVLPTSWDQPVEISGHVVPEPLRQLASVSWPTGATYCNRDTDWPWVWSLEPRGLSSVDAKQFGLVWDGSPLACFGIADGGNDLLLVRLDDPRPANPLVYKVDHDEPGQRLGRGTHLSKFLGTLQPDEREAARRAAHGPSSGPEAVALSEPFEFAAGSMALDKQGPFAPADLARVRSLKLLYATSLDELRHFPNLENLALQSCSLADLAALAHVPTLVRFFATGCVIGDWSGLLSPPGLREVHVPDCQLERLSVIASRPGLEHVTVCANPLGVAALRDLANLPPSPPELPHPGAVELEINDGLRARGVSAACLLRQQDCFLLVSRPSPPDAKGTGTYTEWLAVDLASLRAALAADDDLNTWIKTQPETWRQPEKPKRIDWTSGWFDVLFPFLHPK